MAGATGSRRRGNVAAAIAFALILGVGGAMVLYVVRQTPVAGEGNRPEAGWREDEEASHSDWRLSARPLRTSQGFTVVDLAREDLRNVSVLASALDSRSEGSVVVSGGQFTELRTILRAKLPSHHDDPFDYGVAWRWDGVPYRIEARPMGL